MNHDVRLHVEGMMPERLLERAVESGAVFAHVRRCGAHGLDIHTDARSAEILTALCKKYGILCRMTERSGITRMKSALHRRWTLLPSLALGALICALVLSRIWLVDICFTDGISDPAAERSIEACLKENGVQPGMAAARIDASFLQSQLRAEGKSLSYVGVRRQGIRLLAEVKTEIPAPEIYMLANERDLLAAKSGIVESVTVYSGEACVQPGDTVLAGEVLIRGEEARSKEETAPVGASGKVIARCWYEGCAEGLRTQIQSKRTGNSHTASRLRLGNYSLALTGCEEFLLEETETEILPVLGLYLPLQLERSTHYELVQEHIPINPEILQRQLQNLARADALRKISAENTDYEIASHWTDVQENENTLQLRAVYEIYTDIAVTRDAPTEEVY